MQPGLTYQPILLPVHFNVSASGISIGGNTSLVTPIGTFSIGASYMLPQQGDSIYVILRDHKTGFDHIYKVRSGGDAFTAVINGTTDISVTNNQVLIDVTSGKVEEIYFKRARETISEQHTWSPKIWRASIARWDSGWRESWYKPFSMSRWAYSDSTIGKWFGIGFAWFLIRLALAVVLALIDTGLTIGFLLGQGAFILFGPTGRDVIYGLLVLLAICAVGMARLFWEEL